MFFYTKGSFWVVFSRKGQQFEIPVFGHYYWHLVKTCLNQKTFCFDVAFFSPPFSPIFGFQIFRHFQISSREINSRQEAGAFSSYSKKKQFSWLHTVEKSLFVLVADFKKDNYHSFSARKFRTFFRKSSQIRLSPDLLFSYNSALFLFNELIF